MPPSPRRRPVEFGTQCEGADNMGPYAIVLRRYKSIRLSRREDTLRTMQQTEGPYHVLSRQGQSTRMTLDVRYQANRNSGSRHAAEPLDGRTY